MESSKGPLLLIGLSDGNLKKLAERLPISFPGNEVGFPDIQEIIIMSGTTEDEMEKEIKQAIKKV